MKNCLLIFFWCSCWFHCFGEKYETCHHLFTLNRKPEPLKVTSLVISKDTTENAPQSVVKTEKSIQKIAPPNLALCPGLIFQKQAFGELNLLIGRYESSMSGNALYGLRLGAESNFMNGSRRIWAPKIGVELSGMVVCMRATTLCYMSGLNQQWRFLPELGISFLGFANLTYGYNFKLSGDPINGIMSHRVCLSLNLNPRLMGDVFGF